MRAQTNNVVTGRAAEIFNSAVAASAVGAAWELGAFAELDEHGVLAVEDFAARTDLHLGATTAMFAALASVGIVERDGEKITTGPAFAEVYRSRPLFYWLCQGSAPLFSQMPKILRNANRTGQFYHRDAPAISYASREANRLFFDPVFWTAMDNIGSDFTSVADLGSGSGERLIKIAERYPEIRGLGLDIAQSTIDMAVGEVERHGMSDRISFLAADVRELKPRPEFEKIELLTCFMMGHDMWPREDCIATLRRLRELFPSARRFLLGDTVRTTGIPDTEVPIFTLGFEVGHALMGVYLPTLDEWHEVFADCGWQRITTHVSDALAGTVVFELA